MTNHMLHIGFQTRSNIFLFSALLFLFGLILAQVIDPRIAQLLQFGALLTFVGNGIKLSRFNFESTYFRTLFSLLIIWYAFTIVNGFAFTYEHLKQYLFSDYVLWPYLIPFVAFLSNRRSLYVKIFDWLIYSGILFLAISFPVYKVYNSRPEILEQVIVVFSSGCGFILLTWKYHSKWRRVIAVLAITAALVFATLLARRNVMLTNINFFGAAFLLYFFHYAKGNIAKKAGAAFLILLAFFSAFLIFEARKEKDFSLIMNRIGEDTREYVFDYYFDDIKGYEWTGKGMNGVYFCPLWNPETDVDPVEERDLIECGYLQMVLKGGYISVMLFLLIALPAIYFGLVKSNNGFVKACALIVLLWLIDMIPYGIPSFSIRYILVWFAIGVCYSKSIRLLNDSQILRPQIK